MAFDRIQLQHSMSILELMSSFCIEGHCIAVSVPVWLRGPQRRWAWDLLWEHRLRRHTYIEPIPVRGDWQAHQSIKHNHSTYLWNVLMFLGWLTHQSAGHV